MNPALPRASLVSRFWMIIHVMFVHSIIDLIRYSKESDTPGGRPAE